MKKSIVVANLVTAALASLAVACGTNTAWMPTNSPPHPMTPKSAERVELFTSGSPSHDYVEVGLVTAQLASGVSGDNEFDILQALRAEAGSRGCDGLIVNDHNKMATASGTEHAATAWERTSGFRAACIVYR